MVREEVTSYLTGSVSGQKHTLFCLMSNTGRELLEQGSLWSLDLNVAWSSSAAKNMNMPKSGGSVRKQLGSQPAECLLCTEGQWQLGRMAGRPTLTLVLFVR